MSTLFLQRPRIAVLTLALIVVAGLSALATLPRAEDPDLTPRNATVFARFPGADAERVESLVTEKIEEELREVEEIGELASVSRAGIAIVQIELRDEVTAVDPAWSRVRDHLDDASVLLPEGALDPELVEFDIAGWTLVAGLTWDLGGEPSAAVLRRQAEELQQRWRAVSGTKDVETFGAPTEEIRVDVSPDRLLATGVTPDEVARALARSDAKAPAGILRGESAELVVEVEGEFDSVARVRSVPVRYADDGAVVLLGDLAEVRKTTTDPPTELALVDGRPGVVVAARMEPGLRVDRWSARARAALDGFRADAPRGIATTLLFEQSRYTAERLSGLFANLALGTLLVVLVLFVSMGWRSALLVGTALPLSALMVLIGMNLLDVPLHQMSVTGLIIALGLLIDNAIVMVDEVRHRFDAGDDARDAVRGAVGTLAVPLLGSTLTTVLAFMPILLMPGPAGEFVGAMALSVVLALVSSLFLALTLVPTLSAWLERVAPAPRESGGFWRRGLGNARAAAAWRRALGFLFAHPAVAVVLALTPPFLGFVVAPQLEEQFFPPADRDQFPIEMRLSPLATIEETRRAADRARELCLAHDEVEAVHWFVGRSAPKFYYNMIEGEENAPFFAHALVQLRAPEGARDVIRALQVELDEALPEAQVLVKQLEQGPPFEAPIELRVYGPDLARLQELGAEVREVLSAVPGVTHTRATLGDDLPQLVLATDQVEAGRAGLDRVGVARRLSAHLDGAVGGSLLEGTEELPVRVRLAAGDRDETSDLASLELVTSGPDGPRWVPVDAFGDVELAPRIASITRRDGERVNTVQGFLVAGLLPRIVLEDFQARLERAGFEPPPGYHVEYGGEDAERDDAVANLLGAAGVLLVLMVATLVVSFQSFRLAGLVLLVMVLSIGLGQLALWVFGWPFGFMAIVGSMGLAGVAINDAIVVLAALRADPRARAGDRAAVVDVVARSTRHVLSTTATTVAGFLPLLAAGGEFWPPVAVAIAGGVAGATLLALTLVPAGTLLLVRRTEGPAPAAGRLAAAPA